MNSFCTKEHCTEAAASQDPDSVFVLPASEAAVVAQWLFGLE